DAPDGNGGERSVDFQLADVDFVEGVGCRVIVAQVICFILRGDQRGNPFKEEIPIVGADVTLECVMRDVPGSERLEDLANAVLNVAPPGQGGAGNPAPPGGK